MAKLKATIIQIERQGGHYSDVNGFLKGNWGGYKELKEKGPNGESLYEIYYNRFCRGITINEYGYFYNLFSCQKFDAVLMLNPSVFICEKNNRLGIIDKDGREILHIVYREITPYRLFSDKLQLFIVSTETGKFFFNLLCDKKSEVFDDIFFNYDEIYHGDFCINGVVFQQGDKYGLLDLDGQILLKPIFTYGKGIKRGLLYEFQGYRFHISVKNGLLYGTIPIHKYELCLKVGCKSMAEFYIIQAKSKYGLLNWKRECISEPQYDEIILYKGVFGVEACRTSYFNSNGKWVDTLFVICKKNKKFSLYNLQDGKCIISGCEKMAYRKKNWISIDYEKHGKIGYVTFAGIIVSYEEYESIIQKSNSYIVSKGGKFGALNGEGLEIAPCIYDSIDCNYFGELIANKNGKDIVLNPIPQHVNDEYDSDYDIERPTYDRYSGSYAQDEAGWSDEEIDTVLDGDPDAYWNID